MNARSLSFTYTSLTILILLKQTCHYLNNIALFILMLITKIAQLQLLSKNILYSFALTKAAVPRRFLNRQKPRPALFTQEEKSRLYNPVQAIHLMRLHSFTTFQESVEICVRLNVNPKNGQQIVRGTANLPAGLGKEVKIAILCSDQEWSELQAINSKVDFRIREADLKSLQNGPIEFQKLFTTPQHLPKLKAYGKLLGPKGLMPNSKIGTLVPFRDMPKALQMAKAGQVSFRVDAGRNIHTQIGLMSFTDEQLLINWMAVMKTLVEKRPPSLKGKYFTEAYLKSTMGPRWKVNLIDIDPRTEKSIWGIFDADQTEQVTQKSVR